MEKEKQIRTCFNIGDRMLSKKEKEYINKWFNIEKYDFTLIKLAYDKTIEDTGKMSFAYIDALLSHLSEQ